MISSTTPPRSKSQLVQSINRLPTNVKFDVIEVSKTTDKLKISQIFDRYIKNGNFTVIFISDF